MFDLAKLKELGGLQVGNLLAVEPRLFSKIMRYYSKTIKRDPVTKAVVFLTGLSAYTSDPLNLFERGPTSIGKTYAVTETLQPFPQDDVWYIGAGSPKFLVRQHGLLVDRNGDSIPYMEKPNKKTASEEEMRAWQERLEKLKDAKVLIDLKGKILVFLENPNIELFDILRPILSHDKREISFPYVDKELRTVNVVIRNWPVAIFCSTDEKCVQDLATRSLTITPETTSEKYQDANILSGEKRALPWKYQQDGDFSNIQSYITALKAMLIDEKNPLRVLIPFGREFGKVFSHRAARSMRDFQYILRLIGVVTLLYYAQRPLLTLKTEKTKETYTLATKYDFDLVMSLWIKFSETTETGAPAQILKFFNEVCLSYAGEFTVNEATDRWNSKFEFDRRSSDVIRKWIDFLCDIGYLTKEPDPADKRQHKIKVIKPEKNGNYTQYQLSAFFALHSLEAWLNEVKQINAEKRIVLHENLKTGKELTTIADLFSTFQNSAYIELGNSKGALAETSLTKTESPKSVQFLNFNVNDVKELVRLKSDFGIETCVGCGVKGRPDWQITLFDNTYGLLCGPCGSKVSELLGESNG